MPSSSWDIDLAALVKLIYDAISYIYGNFIISYGDVWVDAAILFFCLAVIKNLLGLFFTSPYDDWVDDDDFDG